MRGCHVYAVTVGTVWQRLLDPRVLEGCVAGIGWLRRQYYGWQQTRQEGILGINKIKRVIRGGNDQNTPELTWVIKGPHFQPNRYRIFTKGQKTRQNRTKLSMDLKRAQKTKAKGTKGLKTELKRTFPDRLDNVCAFNEVKTKSKSTPGYGFGKSMEKQTRNLIMKK
ncbi:hypothetical protein Tco_0951814 [Tanacetum coccineum]|uniref:Uncharacterized protein n=1 Tax=Tanacetum coccineum TaxID=301880 RepID=A0ABQ5DW46_9ASTR